MLRLESYITPFLTAYLNKFIQNLTPEDLKLSIWGGDVVLTNLKLRLDALETLAKLPFSIQSGHIHELRIHIPWLALGSESVKVTISTIEISLQLQDKEDRNHTDATSASSIQQSSAPPPEQEAPPGYIESLLMKIKNNLSLTISNLILKYVEDDIVLSLNVKQITARPCADENWEVGITESNELDPVVRTAAQIEDLTICLDRRNPSTGQIDFYEEPILYRSAIHVRILQRFSTQGQRIPDSIKISTQIDDFTISLSERQLPMSVRLGELFGALYYGHLKPSREVSNSTPEADRQNVEEYQDGWISWAWNSVLGEEESSEGDVVLEKSPPLVAIGIHVKMCTLLLKSGSTRATETELGIRLGGIGVELTIKGEDFFSAVFGITQLEMIYRDRIVGRSGTSLSEKSGISYNYESLFDFRCSENNGVPGEYFDTPHEHFEKWTEPYAFGKYGAFYLDYVFTMKSSPLISITDLPKIENWAQVKEKSWQRIFVPPLSLTVNAAIVESLVYFGKVVKHSYPPYYVKFVPKPLFEEADLDKLSMLSHYVPTRQLTVKLSEVEVTFENEFENISAKLEEAEFVQNEIMYKVPFAHAVANYAQLEIEMPQLAKWCYVTRKFSAKMAQFQDRLRFAPLQP